MYNIKKAENKPYVIEATNKKHSYFKLQKRPESISNS